MLFRRFLTWLYGIFGRPRPAFGTRQPERPLHNAANVLQQQVPVQVPIRQHSSSGYTDDHGSHGASGGTAPAHMASTGLSEDLRLSPVRNALHDPRNNVPICPEGLSKAADDYHGRQFRLANEQYDLFLATDYERLLAWIARLLKEDADHGGALLTLSFDHSTSKVEASGAGLMRAYSGQYFGSAGEFRYFGLPFSTSLTCLDLLIDRLAASTSDHFRALTFHVDVEHREPVYSRRRSTPRTTEVRIFWSATPKRPVVTDEVESVTDSLSDMDTLESLSIVHRAPSYQTAPLGEYGPVFQEQAVELFHCVEEGIGNVKAKAY
jgi:hypothetical protein